MLLIIQIRALCKIAKKKIVNKLTLQLARARIVWLVLFYVIYIWLVLIDYYYLYYIGLENKLPLISLIFGCDRPFIDVETPPYKTVAQVYYMYRVDTI